MTETNGLFDRKNVAALFILLWIFCCYSDSSLAEEAVSCPERQNNCTEMVQPYLREVQYMFPTTSRDVDEMCKVWSKFVDCVRRYVFSCFSDERRAKFNQAVENSVDTVHAICSSETVQREYLSNAVCFRRISVEHCGNFYNQLVLHVSSPKAFDDHICCSYTQFKKCVHDPLLRECGQRARNLMDHSMGFLVSRCADKRYMSVSLNDRCPAVPSDVTSYARSHSDDEGTFSEIHPTEETLGSSFGSSLREHLRDEEHPTPAEHDSLSSSGKQVMDTSFVSLTALVTAYLVTVVITFVVLQ